MIIVLFLCLCHKTLALLSEICLREFNTDGMTTYDTSSTVTTQHFIIKVLDCTITPFTNINIIDCETHTVYQHEESKKIIGFCGLFGFSIYPYFDKDQSNAKKNIDNLQINQKLPDSLSTSCIHRTNCWIPLVSSCLVGLIVVCTLAFFIFRKK